MRRAILVQKRTSCLPGAFFAVLKLALYTGMLILREAIASLGLTPDIAEKLRAWLTNTEQGWLLDEAADEAFYRMSSDELRGAELNLRERKVVMSKLRSYSGEPSKLSMSASKRI